MSDTEEMCKACGKPVQTPIKCSNCNSTFHRACVFKKKYKCPECGHESAKHELRFG